MIDPYAKAITGAIDWSDAMFGYPLSGSDDRDLYMESTDSAPGMPKAVVIEPAFSWGDDRPPKTPWNESIIYEVHVKGFTALHPDLSPASRGTYAGLADYRMIDYLRRLGITAVELMPVHHFVHDKQLLDRGLRNYWGYNSIGFFAPDPDTRVPNRQAPGSTSSRPWSRRCTTRRSRLSWMWSTTTLPKETITDRACPFAASTT